ncbi:MAG: hypothetical protein WC426_02930 [Sulfuriferula sp.]
MREAILAELGLMPLWQVRAEQSQSMVGYVATILQRDDGKTGWLVADAPWTGDVEILSANVCDALGLRKLGESQVVSDNLMQLPGEVAWLWLSGVQPDKCVIAADVPVFASVDMGELVGNAVLKAKLWADWCNWRF